MRDTLTLQFLMTLICAAICFISIWINTKITKNFLVDMTEYWKDLPIKQLKPRDKKTGKYLKKI
jgi:hypothetical protein